ncbi:MAG TPA: ABC transporter ATP-binding protein [Solirubrobacteraceae bacterium]|jgi:peptide/nickel transport system ATP-binding protein|nr:ABC transporter ATP-binding protein [Solirubrobacteraceae bacterium]
MTETPLLEVEDLHVSFSTDDGVVKAVDGASYSVAAGKTLGIVGESGSGKSVSSLTALGLTKGRNTTISGRMLFAGRDLLALDSSEIRQVRGNDLAMIFQDPLSALHPFYTIGNQLIEAVRAHQDVSKAAARARALDLLELVGIPDPAARLDRYPHEFSGGMRQRVMIAMALLNEPKLLIADEPTTALDVTVQAQILTLLQDLQDRLGMAIVIITHDLGVVAEMADDIAVMYAGRIVERAPGRELFAHPQHPYTWGLLKSIPRLDNPRGEDLTPIPGRPPSLINRPSGCHFHPRCPYVRDEHRRVDPRMQSVGGDTPHEVACLLPAQTRSAVWQALSRGDSVQQAQRVARDSARAASNTSESASAAADEQQEVQP